MWQHTILRLLSAFAVTLLYQKLEYRHFASLLICISFSHYLMSFYYSRFRVKQIGQQFYSNYFPIIGLILLAAGTAVMDAPNMIFFFWLHHVWNEVYIQDNYLKADDPKVRKIQLFTRFSLESFVYFSVVKSDMIHWAKIDLPNEFYATGLTLSFLAYTYFTARYRRSFRCSLSADLGAQLVALGFAFYSLYVSAGTVDHILFYHFVFWVFWPLSFLAKERRAIQTYAFQTALSLVVFIPITPIFEPSIITESNANRAIRALGYIHITLSVALSKFHPAMLRKLFVKENAP